MPNHLAPGRVWIIGSGPMALAYARVLISLGIDFLVIGRGEASASTFKASCDCNLVTGGLAKFLEHRPDLPEAAIIATGVEQLAPLTLQLLRCGVNRILMEKPGGLNPLEIGQVASEARRLGAEVYVAYNRRFYASTKMARHLIDEDGGVLSFHFEFTEWSHLIGALQKAPGVKEQWFLANSTHVVDLAFFLGGRPIDFQSYTAGGLPWHPLASIFAGAGATDSGALFSYQANWEAPGRWGLEVLTRKRRLIFRPMEHLAVQRIGSVSVEPCELNDTLDSRFKPGVHRQVEAFLSRPASVDLLSIEEQLRNVQEIHARMLIPAAPGKADRCLG